MKTSYKITAMALLALSAAFTSCEKSDLQPVSPQSTNGTSEQRSAASLQFVGDWKVITYSKAGVDLTEQFDGYTLHFRNGNKLMASNAAGNTIGRWMHGLDAKFSESQPLKLELGDKLPTGDVTGHWNVGSVTQSRIELKRESFAGTHYMILGR